MKKIIPLLLIIFAISCDKEKIKVAKYEQSYGEEPIPGTVKQDTAKNEGGRIATSCIRGKEWRMYQHNTNTYTCPSTSYTYRIEPTSTWGQPPDDNYQLGTVPGSATIRVQNSGETQIKIKCNGSSTWVYLNPFQTHDFVVDIPQVTCMTTRTVMTRYFNIDAKNVGCYPNALKWKYNAWIYSIYTPYTGEGSHTIHPLSSSWFTQSNWAPASVCATCVTY